MAVSLRRWWSVGVALVFSLAAACDDPPVAPQFAAEDAVAETDEVEAGSGIPFADLRLFLEFNSTDNDLGVQLMLDGEAWRRVTGFDPGKKKILQFDVNGRLRQLGLTELFFESAEPSPAEVLGRFPEGDYKFVGRTLENQRLAGTAELSHHLLSPPVITGPADGSDPDNTVITWNAVPGAESYEVIVAGSDVTMEIELEGTATSVTVPPEMLEPSTTYDVEVIAIGSNGNKTITQDSFTTGT